MTTLDEDKFACHDRHFAAAETQSLIMKPTARLEDRDVLRMLDILSCTDWFGFGIDCGHFGRWWQARIFETLNWAADWPGDALLDGFVKTWFDMCLHMMENPETYCGVCHESVKHKHDLEYSFFSEYCPKARTKTHGEWPRNFIEGLEKDKRIRKMLTKHLGTNVPFFGKAHVLLECGKAIAEHAKADEELRIPFLGFAIKFAERFSKEAVGLLNEVVTVTDFAPGDYIDFLKYFIVSISPEDNKNDLKLLLNKIERWRKEESLAGVLAIRRAQERIVPHIHARRERKRRKAGNGLINVTLQLAQIEPIGSFEVADVSYGPAEVCGRGIRFKTTYWGLEDSHALDERRFGDSLLHRKILTAKRVCNGKTVRLEDPYVELSWPGGKLSSRSFSIRSIQYEHEFRSQGSGAVIFLSEDKPEINSWQEYVHKNLSEIDYGRSGRVT